MIARQKFAGIKDTIVFGKYKGKNLKYILEENASYVVWLFEEGVIELPKRIINSAKEKTEKQRLERIVRRQTSYRDNLVHADDDPIYGGCDPNMWGG